MNILPTIVQESVSQCKKQGFVVSAALVSFFLRTQMLTAKKDPQNNVELTPDQIEQLVNTAVRTLTLTNSPMLETFKLQASVTTAQTEQVNQIRTERVQHKAKTQRLIDEVYSKRDPSEVFNDIAIFILHESHSLGAPSARSGPGAAIDDAPMRETIAALDSVFPRSLMDSFIAQREAEKIRQLEEIWRIVWGIRLYNKSTGRGAGAGIPDCIGEASSVLMAITEAALAMQDRLTATVHEYHSVLSSPSLRLADKDRQRLQDEYYNRLQLKLYVRSLLVTLNGLTTRLNEFLPTWDGIMREAQQLLATEDVAAVPKAAIFPKFVQFSERWDVVYGIHREVLDAKALLAILQSYQHTYTATLRTSDVDHAFAGLAPERPVQHEALAAEIAVHTQVEFHADISQDKKDGRLEFNGFCVASFVDDGLLAEGKHDPRVSGPGYLLLLANNAFYAFSSERALKSFAKDPFKYLSQSLIDAVSATPVLIYLLGLHPYLPKELYLYGSRKHDVQNIVEKGDGMTQTGHIDSYKDTHYVWNEWELRRLALQLAGLRNKRTKSSQTVLSHFRRENDSQAYPPKVQSTQTAVDSATQPPRVVRYLKGLRGTESSRIETVTKEVQY